MWVLRFQVATAHAVTLDEAFRAAETAPELRAIVAQETRAQASTGAARAAVIPKLATSAKATWTDEEVLFDLGGILPPEVLTLIGGAPDPITVQQQTWLEAQATLVVPLVDLDAWWTLRAAHQASDAASADVDAVRRQLRLGVARVFYGVRAAREGVVLAEDAVRVARTQEEVAGRRVTSGDAPGRVLLEAEQARLAAERDLAGAREQRVRAESALHRVTGLPTTTPLDDAAPPAPGTAPDPAVRAADLRAEAANAAATAARLGWAPDLTGRVTGAWTQNEGFAPNGTFVFAGVEASWTFDGGYRASRVRDAGASAVAAGALAEAAGRVVEEERANAAAAVTRARASAVAAARELEVARLRHTEAQDAFAQGLIPFYELERAALALGAAGVTESRERSGAALAEVELGLIGG